MRTTTISTRTRKTVNTSGRHIAMAALPAVLALALAASALAGIQNAGQETPDQKTGDPKENARPKSKEKPYGVIFGTAYGPDDHPMYGVRVTIHPEGHKKPSWELMSDHRGEFAQRVPPGPGDYVVTGEVEIIPLVDGKKSKKKRLKGETKVHLNGEEQQDFSLHMNE